MLPVMFANKHCTLLTEIRAARVLLCSCRYMRPRRFSDSKDEKYNYTLGRWLYNEPLRLAERVGLFNVEELCYAAAENLSKKRDDVASFHKIAEGGSYRVFELTFKDGDQVIARLPYPSTVPVTLRTSSEVATMEYLRLHDFPIPKVYAWSALPTNPVGAEYILMEKVPGNELEQIWYSMDMRTRMGIVEQIVNIEKRLFELLLPVSGSLHYKAELDFAFESVEIRSDRTNSKFCVGPSTEYLRWYQNRAAFKEGREPWTRAHDVLEDLARRECLWLKSYGRPRVPEEPFYRDLYMNQEVDPDDHIRSLSEYLRVAPNLVPDDEDMVRPTLRHPDLSPHNIFISDTGQITGVIDWQHSVALPLFLQAKIPAHFQNWGDEASEIFEDPELPKDFDTRSATDQDEQMELYRRRQLHYFYLGFTNTGNLQHYRALDSTGFFLRKQLYAAAGKPWEGDNIPLRAALVRCSLQWKELSSGCSTAPEFCPLSYEGSDVRHWMELAGKHAKADDSIFQLRDLVGVSIDGWVSLNSYQEAVARNERVKANMLDEADTDEDRRSIEMNWPFKDRVEVE